MKLHSSYQKRSIRFLEVYQHELWKIKIYSISHKSEFVTEHLVEIAKQQLGKWLLLTNSTTYETYYFATLLLHDAKDYQFAIINWWIDENMLQHFVYTLNSENKFELFSGNGIVTCVWELAVLWHERNAWVNHVLMKPENPDVSSYLNDHLNQNI